LHDLQQRPDLRQKIKAYEYKLRNQENFELNNIKIDDLIKLSISKPELEFRHVTIDDIQKNLSNNSQYD